MVFDLAMVRHECVKPRRGTQLCPYGIQGVHPMRRALLNSAVKQEFLNSLGALGAPADAGYVNCA